MSTYREVILQQVTARLSTLGVGVYRSRSVAFSRDELPAVVVRPGGETNEQTATDRVKRTFQILIEVHAKARSNPGVELSADQIADPVIASIHQLLFVDRTFGGLLAALFDREMQEPQFTDADETRVGITLVYEAVYMTRSQDITTPTNH